MWTPVRPSPGAHLLQGHEGSRPQPAQLIWYVGALRQRHLKGLTWYVRALRHRHLKGLTCPRTSAAGKHDLWHLKGAATTVGTVLNGNSGGWSWKPSRW